MPLRGAMVRIVGIILLVTSCVDVDEPDVAETAEALTDPAERPMAITFESPAGCLDAMSGDLYGRLAPAACSGAAAQRWRVHPSGEIQSEATGMCLAWTTRSLGRNGEIQRTGLFLEPCQTAPGWIWAPSTSGELRSGSSCLVGTPGAISLPACDGTVAQRWTRRLPPATSSLEDSFGFGAMRRQMNHVVQTVPLARVYVNYQRMNDGRLAHPISYYEALLFGSRFPSLAAFLADASSGLFRFSDAGTYGPFDDDTTASGCDDGAVIGQVLERFMYRSIDLARYDADGDRVVEHDELQIMIIANCGGRLAGAARPVGCLADVDSGPGHLQLCVIEIEDQVGFATLAHESLHALGAVDIYPWGNVQLSTMAGTITPFPDNHFSFMLDAWHRFQLGWNRPLFVALDGVTTGRGTITITGDRNWHTSVVFGSPDKFGILEKREPTTYGPDTGILFWTIEASPFSIRTNSLAPYLYPYTANFMHELVLTDGRSLGFWDDSGKLGWRLGCELDVNVVENSHTSQTVNITVRAADRFDARPTNGTVTTDGVPPRSLGQAFDYERKYDFACDRFGCGFVPRPRTFEVKAPGCAPVTFTRT